MLGWRWVTLKNANEHFIYLWLLIILDCTVEKGAAALRGYQLAKNNRYWKCTLTSRGTINQRSRWPRLVPQITVMKAPVSHEGNTNFKEEETTRHKKNKEENLDIVSSQGYYAIKDPDWSGRNTTNSKYSKKKEKCVYVQTDKRNHSEVSEVLEADLAICYPVLQDIYISAAPHADACMHKNRKSGIPEVLSFLGNVYCNHSHQNHF